jgi:dihydrodipicolinate synthase/N-acetylneuraminate lyase
MFASPLRNLNNGVLDYEKQMKGMAMKDQIDIRGIVCPMLTPFDKQGQIDIGQVKTLTDYVIEGGVEYLLPAGTTGEGILLSLEERMRLDESVVEAAGDRAKVIAHTGCASTQDTIALTQHAKEVGAFGASIIAPFFYTYTQQELLDHYSAIARQVPDFPLLLYSFPGNAKNPISTGLLQDLTRDFPNYVGIKLSDVNLIQFQEYVIAGGENFNVLCGVDALMLPALSVGSKGQVSGNSNVFPEVFRGLYDAYTAGDLEKAQELQRKINRIRAVLKDDIAYFKAALAIKGMDVGLTRAPIHNLTAAELEKLADDLADL